MNGRTTYEFYYSNILLFHKQYSFAAITEYSVPTISHALRPQRSVLTATGVHLSALHFWSNAFPAWSLYNHALLIDKTNIFCT